MARDIVTSENRAEYMAKKLGKEEDKPAAEPVPEPTK